MPKKRGLTVDETVKALIERYDRESKHLEPMHSHTARAIVAVLTNNPPETAHKLLRRWGNEHKGMSIGSFYVNAATELGAALRRASRKAAKE